MSLLKTRDLDFGSMIRLRPKGQAAATQTYQIKWARGSPLQTQVKVAVGPRTTIA